MIWVLLFFSAISLVFCAYWYYKFGYEAGYQDGRAYVYNPQTVYEQLQFENAAIEHFQYEGMGLVPPTDNSRVPSKPMLTLVQGGKQ